MTNKELEAYAALVLVETAQICEPFSADWLKDRPDLQIGNFGIEVTSAIGTKDAEQRQLDSTVLDCETYKDAIEYISNLNQPKEYRSEPMQLSDSDRFSLMSGGGYDDKKPLALIVNAIEVKSEKFLKYPNHKMFSRRGLYIFDQELRPCMQLLDIEAIVKSINASVFDVVFIHHLRRLIVVEKGDIPIQEYPFDKIKINDTICKAKRVCDSPDYEICCERAKVYRESIIY